MNVGMLWFDNDTKVDLTVKIERAVTYYQHKYGKRPNLCYIHPCMAPTPNPLAPPSSAPPKKEGEAVFKSGGVEVHTTRSVLPNHLWLGITGANGNGHATS